MPEEVDAGRIVASIALDSGALSKGAQEAAKKLKDLNTLLTDNQQKQKESSKVINEAKNKLNELNSKIGDTNKANEKQKQKVEELNDTIEKEQEVLDDLKKEQDNIKDAISETSKELVNNNEQWTVLKGTLANLGAEGIKKVAGQLKGFCSDVIKTGEQFSASMSEVQAISGATTEELKELEETARLYGSTTQFSASEAADALKYMALAGWDTEQSLAALPGILDLAAASGMALGTSSDMVTDYLSAFGMAADKAGYFADLLTYAQGNSSTSAQQLGEAYRNCAANLNAAGQDIETVTSLLEAMANQGLKGSEAGTAVAAMMRDITNKMEDGKIKIGDTTIAVQDMAGNFRDLTAILFDVEKAVNGMGSSQKAAAFSSTFTAESIKGVNLVLNEGMEKISGYEEALRNSTGAASDAAAVMNDNLRGDIKSMESAFDELKLKIFEDAEAPMRKIVQWITKNGIPAIEALAKNIDKIIPIVVAATAAMLSYKAAVAIEKIINGVRLGIAGLTAAKKAHTTATVTDTAATKGATAAQIGLNTAMAANPIGLVVAALGALISLLGTYSVMAGKSTNETKKYRRELENFTKIIDDARKSSADRITQADAEAQYLSNLAEDYDRLRNKVALTESEKKLLRSTSKELAKTLGITTQELKNKDGTYRDITKDVDEYIKKLKEQVLWESHKEEYQAAVVSQENSEKALASAKKVYKAAWDELDRFRKMSYEDLNKELGFSGSDFSITEWEEAYEKRYNEIRKAYEHAGGTMFDYYRQLRHSKEAVAEAEAAMKGYTGAIDESSIEMETYEQVIADALGESTDAVSEFADKGNKSLDVFFDSVDDFSDAIEDSKKKLEELAKEEENLKKQSSSLRSEMNSLASSMSSLEKGETLSYNTLLDLIDKYPEYASELSNAAGNANLQKSALEKLFEAKKQEYTLTQQAAIDNIKASNDETSAIIKNIKKQIEAHADLQTVIVNGLRLPMPTGETLVDLVELNKYQQQLKKNEELIKDYEAKINFVNGLKIGDLTSSGKDSGTSSTNKDKNEIEDLRKKEVDSLSKIGEALTEAIKNRYTEQKKLEEKRIDESIENWQKWENETVGAIQGQIDALDELKNAQQEENRREEYEQKRQALELEMRYAKDDYNRKKIQKQIAALDKNESERLYELEIEERKKALQKEAKNARTVSKEKQNALREQKTSISEKYNTLMSDKALEGEARNMFLNNSSKEISEFIGTYAPEFDLLGTKLGERIYEAFKSRIGDVSGFADKITAAVDNDSGRTKATSELKAWSSLSGQRSRELEKNFSTQALKNKIVEMLDKYSAPIKTVSEYKGMLAYTANSAADRFYDSSGGKIQTSSGGTAKTVNVYLTANFNGQVNSPVQVKRQLESVGQEIAKQII